MTSEYEAKISQRYTCTECGGRLRITDTAYTDASSWEEHECVDCGSKGEFYISEGTKRDGGRTYGVTERNYDLQP